jgi:hypothetical protein|tara:strand:- start:7749 stop:7982 length:234 start_codon:yes stop_codon:yes gene_type:complete
MSADRTKPYTTAYGEIIEVGQQFILNGDTYKIEKLEVIRYAGLIASYTSREGKVKKTNISTWTYNEGKRLWMIKEQK